MKLQTIDHRPQTVSRGYTLVELVVVVGIFMIVSSVILANYPSFSRKVSVQNLAHQIALEIRQAQVYGLSVKETTAGSAIFPGYGVYFTPADNSSFVLYSDGNNNKKYDYAGEDCSSPSNIECLEKVRIASGDNIRDICVTTASGAEKCATGGELDYLNIAFVRPDPDANITGTYGVADTIYQSAKILVEPPKKDFYKSVIVWSTGQISVQ